LAKQESVMISIAQSKLKSPKTHIRKFSGCLPYSELCRNVATETQAAAQKGSPYKKNTSVTVQLGDDWLREEANQQQASES
jgi:hypothetical protein